MLKIEDIRKDATLHGIEPGQVVRVITTDPLGPNVVTIYYKTADGRVQERMLLRSDEPNFSLAEGWRPWAFDASNAEFKLGVEAYSIHLSYLFDPMVAVHTSNVDPTLSIGTPTYLPSNTIKQRIVRLNCNVRPNSR